MIAYRIGQKNVDTGSEPPALRGDAQSAATRPREPRNSEADMCATGGADLKLRGSPIAATAAVAVSTPSRRFCPFQAFLAALVGSAKPWRSGEAAVTAR